MANSQHKGPKGSEVPIQEWLEQIGATEISYVGERGSPPDFTITYSGKRIAIEVARLLPDMGWDKKTEIAFETELRNLIEENSAIPIIRDGILGVNMTRVIVAHLDRNLMLGKNEHKRRCAQEVPEGSFNYWNRSS